MKRTPIKRATPFRAKPKRLTKEEKEAYREATERARDEFGTLHCAICGLSILDGQEQRHHRKYRSQGGETTVENIIIVCLDCHHDIHG